MKIELILLNGEKAGITTDAEMNFREFMKMVLSGSLHCKTADTVNGYLIADSEAIKISEILSAKEIIEELEEEKQ